MRALILAATGAAGAVCCLATGASAVTKHHHHYNVFVYTDSRPPITVTKRSWLDPGPVVPQGTMESYVTESTGFNETPDQRYERSRFGNETLPRPLYPTGRPEPVVEFWTPGYPY